MADGINSKNLSLKAHCRLYLYHRVVGGRSRRIYSWKNVFRFWNPQIEIELLNETQKFTHANTPDELFEGTGATNEQTQEEGIMTSSRHGPTRFGKWGQITQPSAPIAQGRVDSVHHIEAPLTLSPSRSWPITESNRPPLPLSFDARPDSTALSPMTETELNILMETHAVGNSARKGWERGNVLILGTCGSCQVSAWITGRLGDGGAALRADS
ncbi:hypothetical protein BC826DRAFT_970923 [Russula brevipes]|nr:hypothetical protein BC826DRAFT_970923 [Russula brevipes]